MNDSGVNDSRRRFLAALNAVESESFLTRLCVLGEKLVPADSVVIVAPAGDTIISPIAASNQLGFDVANLELDLGEGPSLEVIKTGKPMRFADLATQLAPLAPLFTNRAQDLGVAAVFSFPIQVGGIRLGALTLLKSEQGELGDSENASAIALNDLCVDAILLLQSGLPMENFPELLQGSDLHQPKIHQATGMIAQSLGCSMSVALALLRARAFRLDMSLKEYCALVVSQGGQNVL